MTNPNKPNSQKSLEKLRRKYAQIKRFTAKPEICPVYGCGVFLPGAMHKQIHWKHTGHLKPVR
jgi:hypothetical protein